MAWKAIGTIEKALVIKRARTTKPKAQKKINLEPVKEPIVEEEVNECQMTIT